MKQLVASLSSLVVTTSHKPQATNHKRQAASCKLLTNNKAIMFTVAASLFAVVIFSLVAIKVEQSREQGEAMVYKVRCNELNTFLDDVSADLGRAAAITAKRAATHAVDFVATSGTPLQNATSSLLEMTLNGTLNGVPIASIQNQTFIEWSSKIKTLAEERHFATNINANQITLNFVPYTSWEFRVRARLSNLQVTDVYEYCSFNGTLPRNRDWVISNVSVLGLEDPLYMLKSRGYVSRTMLKDTNYTLAQHSAYQAILFDITSKTYHESFDGPSFFEKLEGKLGAYDDSIRHDYYIDIAYGALLEEGLNISRNDTLIGMETFVDVSELMSKIPASVQPLVIRDNQTVIDHLYFGSPMNGRKIINVTDTSYPWFRIDTAHANYYNISEYQLYD